MVGPGRSWLLPEDGWPTMLFPHRARDTVKDQAGTMLYEDPLHEKCAARDVRTTRMQRRHKGSRPKRAATSRKQEGIQQDRQTDFQTEGREASRWDFHWVAESEWLDTVEGLTLSETKEETTSSSRARDIGASTTLGTFACTNQKWTLDRGWWWYSWPGTQPTRESLGMSLKEGVAWATGE
jgi:hypothetical protein